LAKAWADNRENELKQPGAIERQRHRGVTVGQVLNWYLDDFDGRSKFGRTKLSHLIFLAGYSDLADLDAIELSSQQVMWHVHQRRREGTGPATVNNDLIWLRNAFRSAQIS